MKLQQLKLRQQIGTFFGKKFPGKSFGVEISSRVINGLGLLFSQKITVFEIVFLHDCRKIREVSRIIL